MNETMLNTSACGATKEPSTGEQLLSMARRIASEAEAVAKHAQDKLSPLMVSDSPMNVIPDNKAELQRAWPPYFYEIRCILQDISASIVTIKRTINRVEL